MPNNVLSELSPYGWGASDCWKMWSIVLDILRRYEQTGIPQPELPRSIQRPGALIGLSIGLAVRQAALPRSA
ncbi:MAG TPA: hypothetical protein VMZ53_01340 [Kofleriaceae bacterium]|nr:hypothetical protein [Kofleriaceae bacterium]